MANSENPQKNVMTKLIRQLCKFPATLTLALLMLSFPASGIVNSEGQAFQDEYDISAHKYNTCVIDDSGVNCWGEGVGIKGCGFG